MAAITFGTGVVAGAGATVFPPANSGVVTLAGQAGYVDPADGLIKKASIGLVTADYQCGVIINSAPTAGQPNTLVTEGTVNGCTGLVQGTVYYISATQGSVCPEADLVSGNRVLPFCVALSSTSVYVFKKTYFGVSRA